MPADPSPDTFSVRNRIGLVAGPAAFLAVLALPPPSDLDAAAWRTAAVAVLMATWWITEAIPLAATGLVPIALLPLLGIAPIADATAPFAHPLIFLFLGGFLIALALERWSLHKRIALRIIRALGTRRRRLLVGFMGATAFLSMWISNTATTLLMLPIGLSVVALARPDDVGGDPAARDPFEPALLLAIAFGAGIGGIGTLIGTPPNALTAAFLQETYGIEIGFVRWLSIGLPMVAVGLPLTYWILTRFAFRVDPGELPGGAALLERELAALGRWSTPEKRVAVVFGATALAWMTRPLLVRWIPELSDAGIAVLAGLALFTIPAGVERGRFLLDWDWARRLPWGVLLLFGGGLSLASAIDRTGLAASLADALSGVSALGIVALLLLVVVTVIVFSELASNTATAAAFLPVVGALAVALGVAPIELVVPAGLAASGGYMLPVATPPNAIVYGTGRVEVVELVRAGALLDVVFVFVVTAIGVWLVPSVFG